MFPETNKNKPNAVLSVASCRVGYEAKQNMATNRFKSGHSSEPNVGTILMLIVVLALVQSIQSNEHIPNGTHSFQESRLPSATKTTSQRLETLKNDFIHKWPKYVSQTGPHNDLKYCECDTAHSQCSVDCCCDRDCRLFQMLAFSHCKPMISSDSNTRTVRNRCQAPRSRKWFRAEPTPLCSKSRSTLPELFYDSSSVTAPTLENLFTITQKRFKWSIGDVDLNDDTPALSGTRQSPSFQTDPLEKGSQFKSGMPLFVVVPRKVNAGKNNESGANNIEHRTELWQLPVSINSDYCNARQTLKYLRPFSSDCIQIQDNSLQDCSSAVFSPEYYSNIAFFYDNLAEKQHRTISVQVLGQQKRSKFIRPNVRNCENSVSEVHYTLVHEGIYGIVRAEVNFVYSNISGSMPASYRQRFTVNYRWSDKLANQSDSATSQGNDSNIHKPDRKRPVQFDGYRRFEGLYFADSKLERLHDHSWLSFSQHSNGQCKQFMNDNPEQNSHQHGPKLLFGVNKLWSCQLQIEFDVQPTATIDNICGQFRSRLNRFMIQDRSARTDIRVSSLLSDSLFSVKQIVDKDKFTKNLLHLLDTTTSGNNFHHESSYSTDPGRLFCTNLTTGIEYFVATAKHGRPSDYKSRIVSMGFRIHQLEPYTSAHSLHLDCRANTTNSCRASLYARLWSSMNFIDLNSVSKTASLRPQWAPAPSFRIELPNDFFYPFQTHYSTSKDDWKIFERSQAPSSSIVGLSHHCLYIRSILAIIIITSSVIHS